MGELSSAILSEAFRVEQAWLQRWNLGG